MTPQLVDLNADGHQDMVMATFEGTAFLVAGSRNGWKKPEHIVDRKDANVRIAMYWDLDKENYLSVDRSAGDYKNNEQHHMTSMSVVDWDDDGDHDLLLGAYEGALYLCMNEGTPSEPKFAEHNLLVNAGGNHVTFDGGLATPRVVDWDGDGLFDILCGGSKGGVELLHNVGEKGKPKFDELKTLVAAHDDPMSIKSKNGTPTLPGNSFHVEALDYDKDGDMDLLVGAKTFCKSEPKELSAEEEKELGELHEKLEALIGALDAKVEEVGEDDKEAMKKLSKSAEIHELSQKMRKLRQEIGKLEPADKEVNLVWLYRNKAKSNGTRGTAAMASQSGIKTSKPAIDSSEVKYDAPTDLDSKKFEVRAQLHRTSEDTAKLVVFVNVPKGFHIYGRKSDVEPTSLKVSKTEGMELTGDANVPIGRMVVKSGSPAFWLENVVTITQDIKVKGDFKSVSGSVAYMICNEQGCRPPDEEKFVAEWVEK